MRTAQELKQHLQMLEAKGLDLSKVLCWGWDDGSVIFDSPDFEHQIDGIDIDDFDAGPKIDY